MRSLFSFVSALVLSVAVMGSILLTPASAERKPPPPPPSPPPATWSTDVKDYGSVINGVKCDRTPETVEATSDGRSIALALSSRLSVNASDDCAGTGWLVKRDSSGTPQWQENVGCLTPPASGGYSYGLTLKQTADGGNVIAGGTVDCDWNPICAYLTSGLLWVDREDRRDRQAPLGAGLLGVADRDLLRRRHADERRRPDRSGDLRRRRSACRRLDREARRPRYPQWQRKIGPAGATYAYFSAVRQAADGGYVAADFHYGHGCGEAVLVVELARRRMRCREPVTSS
jgi:hypothetical protein